MTQNPFELTAEQNEQVFQDVIVPFFTHNRVPSSNPQFIFLTAQPGAGKSTLSAMCSRSMNARPILFGADDLRALHPHRDTILQQDESNYVFITKKDAGLWREKLVDYAIKHRYNLLIESILVNPNDYKLGTIERARQAGYKVTCAALGVHEQQSLLGMYSRYEEQKRLTGKGFAPTLVQHQNAYQMLPQIIGNMHNFKTVDSIAIYNRNLEQFYYGPTNKEIDNSKISGIIHSARNSLMNDKELSRIHNSWERILLSMDRRNADTAEIELVEKLFKQFQEYVKKQNQVSLIHSKSKER